MSDKNTDARRRSGMFLVSDVGDIEEDALRKLEVFDPHTQYVGMELLADAFAKRARAMREQILEEGDG